MRLFFCVCVRVFACMCVRACLLQAYRGALLTAAQAVGYEEAKTLFVSSPAIAADPSNLATHLAASMLAGLVSTTAVRTPFSCSLATAALSSNFFFGGGGDCVRFAPLLWTVSSVSLASTACVSVLYSFQRTVNYIVRSIQ